ncbi:MAG: 16S rRNA (guanine(527)-N(7))-methyltransferase RsmG [Elusimicrobiota bacterium]|jgi:16S rRNA (guanine527-N7)-methyltransferase|nr:16S rRNA (guanine(527)-N(7))-methyltransferase RsmG [Elusimicrobiota bacterium]
MKVKPDFVSPLNLSAEQLAKLREYAALVWQKRETLNLTSVRDEKEIWDRHILDGLAVAALLAKEAKGAAVKAADYGAGAGYIGISMAVAAPNANIALVESLERRCRFLEWAVFKLGLKNVKVLNMRAGECNRVADAEFFDFATQRAMGKLDDVLQACTRALRAGGVFAAYQAAASEYNPLMAQKCGVRQENIFEYALPDGKARKLVIFRKL